MPPIPPMPTKRPKPLLARMLPALLGITGVVLLFFLLAHLFLNPGRFDRAKFEAIVARLRQMKLPVGKEDRFMMDDLSDPNSLRPLKPKELLLNWSHSDLVWVRQNSPDDLDAVIVTRDCSHFGRFGFAYTTTRMTPELDDEEGIWCLCDLTHAPVYETTPDMKIDDHWWGVEDIRR